MDGLMASWPRRFHLVMHLGALCIVSCGKEPNRPVIAPSNNIKPSATQGSPGSEVSSAQPSTRPTEDRTETDEAKDTESSNDREAKSRKITLLKDKIARKQKMLDQKDALRQQYMMLVNGSDVSGANAKAASGTNWAQLGQTLGNLAGGTGKNSNTFGTVVSGIGGVIGFLGSQATQEEAQGQFETAKTEALAQIKQIDLERVALQNEINQLEEELEILFDS